MALSSAQVWEVRAAGSDLNGGAFKAGASGSDYSQQDGPQVTYNDLTIDATQNTKVTSAATPFTSAHVGNVINVTGGTGFNLGRFEVVSVTASVATLDRSPGGVGLTGGVGNLGGAVLTLSAVVGSLVAGNKVWVRSGSYPMNSALTFSQSVSGNIPLYNLPPSQLLGYASVRGDITENSPNQTSRPTILINAALAAPALTFSGAGWHCRNLIVAAGAGSFTHGISATNAYVLIHNCKVSGHSSNGVSVSSSNGLISYCEVTGGGATSVGLNVASSSSVERCYIHDTSGVGIAHGSTADVINCVVDTLAGVAADGIQVTSSGRVLNCVVYGAGRHGISMASPSWMNRIRGNIIANNPSYGLNCSTAAGYPSLPEMDGNAFFANALGTRNSVDDSGTGNAVNGSALYINTSDVVLAFDPFVDSLNSDFRLNNSVGGGAACRAAAPGSRSPGLVPISYRDMGVYQHQDSGITNISFIEG